MARTEIPVRVEHDGTLETAREIGELVGRLGAETLPAFLRDRLDRCRAGDLIEVADRMPCADPDVIVLRVVPSAAALTLLADLRARSAL